MARRYSRSTARDVKNEMHRYKRGTAKSGRGGKGGRVQSRRQAIAIALSKARKKGKKAPKTPEPLIKNCRSNNSIGLAGCSHAESRDYSNSCLLILKLFPTTLTLEIAIAPAATIGFKSPRAAKGIAAIL